MKIISFVKATAKLAWGELASKFLLCRICNYGPKKLIATASAPICVNLGNSNISTLQTMELTGLSNFFMQKAAPIYFCCCTDRFNGFYVCYSIRWI